MVYLIQYSDKHGGKVHRSSALGTLKSCLTICGKLIGFTVRPYKMWWGKLEEVTCRTCKTTIK